ncbi:hypothetical protein [Bradyrhizobium sp. AZCC 2289]|uniref:hypothetical protein n=1 Tax=Bradyrhizobium sp. AZCC 2289 TaxID=3117026 RepID=UPI002FF05A00
MPGKFRHARIFVGETGILVPASVEAATDKEMRVCLSILELMSPSRGEAILVNDQRSKMASFIVKDAMEKRPKRWARLLIL